MVNTKKKQVDRKDDEENECASGSGSDVSSSCVSSESYSGESSYESDDGTLESSSGTSTGSYSTSSDTSNDDDYTEEDKDL
ncbi:hypothetical protein CWI38_0196p0030 [Hamiltosporidium tvaerminnensis]|nr:hypothetical protein LUQ84_002844 [Hamiltosporidium tvaerminnensis]TBT97972.1 hypothetical protein CWI37_1972p0010 [Hamiltosporidium tvaerminnensis]TBU19814.1 hypothetical protein CWI38_0196p0030 [Hamiltosporidium tvaerminnensis]